MTDTPTERATESTWARLRRRKVVQWGLVYVAAAWGFLQGLEYISESFNWPQEVRQIAVLVLVIGLPIVLVLAWYHGDRGQQRITTPEFAILTSLLLLGGGAFWYYQRAIEAGKDAVPASNTVQPAASAAVSDARPSIAVLPFENRSDVEKDAFFVDGIHDDVLTQLSKVSALRVISRTSVEQFRDTKLSSRAIAEQLGVTSLLEGGVQRAGDRVLINVQLIDAATDAHVWAERFDRDLTVAEVFAIQGEVAAAIAGALETALTPAEQARAQIVPTRNLAAWEAYQRGRRRVERRSSAELAEAEEQFRTAVALDPQFALAWVGLADTLAFQTFYSRRPLDAGLDEAKQAVGRALELDANLAEAWASAGNIANQRLEFKRAEQLLRRAIKLNPNYASAYHWLGLTLEQLGRRDEHLTMLERAVVLDPRSAVINLNLGGARRGVGRFDDALVAYKQAIEIDPTMAAGYAFVAHVHAHSFGRFDAALPWFEKAASLDPGNPGLPCNVAEAYWEIGDDAEAGRWLARTLALGEASADACRAVATQLNVTAGDMEATRRHADRAAELDGWDMGLIRDFDLRSGDYATARIRYAKAFPNLFATDRPTIDNDRGATAAIELALVLQGIGETERARVLLDRSEAYVRTIRRIADWGFYEVAIHAMRGDTSGALTTLREIARGGPRTRWRYFRDFAPEFASVRNEPEFKAVFADIERDMAQQRARLAARPKDAPLELTDASR